MIRFLSPHPPWCAVLNFQIRRSYNSLTCDLALLCTCTLGIICRKEYSLTLDAIKNALPSRKKVSLALDTWTSMNKLAIAWSLLTVWIDIGHRVKCNLHSMRLITTSFLIPNFTMVETSRVDIQGQGFAYIAKMCFSLLS